MFATTNQVDAIESYCRGRISPKLSILSPIPIESKNPLANKLEGDWAHFPSKTSMATVAQSSDDSQTLDAIDVVTNFVKSRNKQGFENSIADDIELENLRAEDGSGEMITSAASLFGKKIAKGIIDKFWWKEGFQIGAWQDNEGGLTVTARNSRLGRRIAFHVNKHGFLDSIITVGEDLTTSEEQLKSDDSRLAEQSEMLFS